MTRILQALLTAGLASATGVLLPLYVYPSAEYNDGAANWTPVINAIASAPSSVPWLVVVNPSNGPGPTGQPGNNDINYKAGLTRLNALGDHVRTIGYVRTDYGASPLTEVNANITTWASWSDPSSGGSEDLRVEGIFFDETSASASALSTLSSAISHARSAFSPQDIVTICNFGTAVGVDAYSICDIVVAFEGYLNRAGSPPAYAGRTTIEANVPTPLSQYAPQAAVIVHDFAGTAVDGRPADVALLESYVAEAEEVGLGWVYFTSADYNSITTAPATIGALAAAF